MHDTELITTARKQVDMGYDNENAQGIISVEPIVLDIETTAHLLAEQWLEPVNAPANYKDAEKIAAAKREKAAAQLNHAALDGAVNRIVAIGWGSTRMEPVVALCKDEDQEARALEQFWAMIQTGSGTRRLIQFNGLHFDLPIMLTRSSLLNLKAPVLNLSKYEKNPNTDLMLSLSHYGAMPVHGLQFWCSRYRIADLIPAPAPEVAAISGADIPRLVAENTDLAWSLIHGHCEHDIRQTVALAKRLDVI